MTLTFCLEDGMKQYSESVVIRKKKSICLLKQAQELALGIKYRLFSWLEGQVANIFPYTMLFPVTCMVSRVYHGEAIWPRLHINKDIRFLKKLLCIN